MKLKFLFIVIFGLTIICASFSQKNPVWKGKIEYEDGVKVIKNPKEPMYQGQLFSIEPELSIGKQTGAKEYLFGRISNEKTYSTYFNSHSVSFLWP